MMLCQFVPLYEFQSDVCPPALDGLIHKDDNDHQPTIDDTSSTNKTVSDGLRRRNGPAVTEYIIAIWIFTLLCEETRQVT